MFRLENKGEYFTRLLPCLYMLRPCLGIGIGGKKCSTETLSHILQVQFPYLSDLENFSVKTPLEVKKVENCPEFQKKTLNGNCNVTISVDTLKGRYGCTQFPSNLNRSSC